jgi:L-amino acid N-acyltransferase YncA
MVVQVTQRARHEHVGRRGRCRAVSDVAIRDATDDDWPRIWPFFRRIVADGETYAYPEDLTEKTARPLWMEPRPGRTVVAVDADGTVLGSAKMGPNRPGRGAHVATASFMVDPDHAGRGIGRALGEYVVAWGREEGYQSMQFNAVVETNTAAVSLWRSLGFEVLTTVPEAFDSARHGRVGLHVMFRYLQG